ncbi:hypothetical protein [Deinococcus peraridilitoris]|nr:hypothetical protein [Deinococcus peraridilitoris]
MSDEALWSLYRALCARDGVRPEFSPDHLAALSGAELLELARRVGVTP